MKPHRPREVPEALVHICGSTHSCVAGRRAWGVSAVSHDIFCRNGRVGEAPGAHPGEWMKLTHLPDQRTLRGKPVRDRPSLAEKCPPGKLSSCQASSNLFVASACASNVDPLLIVGPLGRHKSHVPRPSCKAIDLDRTAAKCQRLPLAVHFRNMRQGRQMQVGALSHLSLSFRFRNLDDVESHLGLSDTPFS